MSRKHTSKRIQKPLDLNRVLPKKGSEKHTVTSVRLRDELLAKLDAIAKKQGYTRNETVTRLLEWACGAFFQEELRNETTDAPDVDGNK